MLIRIAKLVPMPCGMNQINKMFNELKLSEYQPVTHRISSPGCYDKLFNGMRSRLVVIVCNMSLLTRIINEFTCNASLTECNVRTSYLDANSATKLAAVAKKKRIMLFGINRDQAEADFAWQNLTIVDDILIESDLTVSASLRRINLKGNELCLGGAKHIAKGIRVSASLTHINLKDNKIDSEGAKHIAEGIRASASLTSIDLGRNCIGKEMALQLIRILSQRQMVSVGLARCNLSGDGAQAVAEYIRVSASLTSIDLSNANLTDHGEDLSAVIAIAEAIGGSRSLTSINLRSNNFGSKGAKHIAEGIAVSASLKSIDLGNNQIGVEGCTCIVKSIAVSARLTGINLGYNDFEKQCTRLLMEGVLASDSLTDINLKGNDIGCEGAQAIADVIIAGASLTSINLAYNFIGPEGAYYIAKAMASSASLKSVNLRDNILNRKGAWHIAHGISDSKSLTSIDLVGCDINNPFPVCEASRRIARFISANASLRSIDIGYNGTDKTTAIELIGIFTTKQLVFVGLADCSICADGAKPVADYIAVSTSLTKVPAFCK